MGKFISIFMIATLFAFPCQKQIDAVSYNSVLPEPIVVNKDELIIQMLEGQKKEEERRLEEEKERKQKLKLNIKKTTHSVKNKIHREHDTEHLINEEYTDIKGILTFRGNNFRDQTSVGVLQEEPKQLELLWKNTTSGNSSWGGGSGWTGQPLVIQWDHPNILGVLEPFKSKESLTEVIQISLDGSVYFYDLETGEKTRERIVLGNPIKGTPALDSRGYPLLFVGEGIPQSNIGLSIINLITNKVVFKIPGIDPFATRKWGAFDGSPLISKETDTMVTNGENGIVYNVKLNTEFDQEKGTININPKINKMLFTYPNQKPGIESSIIADGPYLFTADNKGMIQAIDANTLETLWSVPAYDDTDSTMILNIEDDTKYLYTASEIDLQGSRGVAKVRKIEAENGKVIWEKDFNGYSIVGNHPVNGGFLASPLKGEGALEGQMIFTMARGNSMDSGYIVGLDQKTGEIVWQWDMKYYAWSSPAGISDEAGNFYIVQADSVGNVFLIKNGTELIDQINVGANIEASPIIFENKIIFGSRGGHIFGYEIK